MSDGIPSSVNFTQPPYPPSEANLWHFLLLVGSIEERINASMILSGMAQT
jgi:hypothetical protein